MYPFFDCDPKAMNSRHIIPPAESPFSKTVPLAQTVPITESSCVLPIHNLEQLWDQKDLYSIQL